MVFVLCKLYILSPALTLKLSAFLYFQISSLSMISCFPLEARPNGPAMSRFSLFTIYVFSTTPYSQPSIVCMSLNLLNPKSLFPSRFTKGFPRLNESQCWLWFFGTVLLLSVAYGAWSCCQLRGCRYTAALHTDTSAGLFIVLQGPCPVTDWCLPASWPSARLAYRVWLKVISRKLAHMDHELHSAFSVFPPPCLSLSCSLSFFFGHLLFPSLISCTLVRAKCEAYTEMQRLYSWKMCN